MLISKLWPHQQEALAFMQARASAMLAIPMGGGKSRVPLEWLNQETHAGRPVELVLIACPKSVISVWEAEIKKYLNPALNPLVLPLSDKYGTVIKRTAFLKMAQDTARNGRNITLFAILNYDVAWREPLASLLTRTPWGLLIMDESHRLAKPSGRTSRFFAKLPAKHRVQLTGTPFSHSPLSIYAQFRALAPGFNPYGRTHEAFKQQYAIMGGYMDRQVVAYKNLADLERKFSTLAYRCTINLGLPDTLEIVRTCQLDGEAKKIYKQMEKLFWAEVEQGEVTAANAAVKLLKLQQISGGFVITDLGLSRPIANPAKLTLLQDLLDDFPLDEPLVIFARFKNDIALIRALCLDSGRQVCELSGNHNDLAAWQAGKAPVLIAQLQAGSLGVDLTRAAYAIYYSLDFSLANWEQSKARLHRPGQTRGVRYIYLIVENTIDEDILKALQKRQDVIKSIMEKRGTYARSVR